MYYVIIEGQDFYGFAIVDQDILNQGQLESRIVYSGTKSECDNFYQERVAEWVDSQESHLCE